MKKLVLFMFFAIAMVSLLIVGASAATEGTPIATVEDFENINLTELAEGQEAPKYYLANDIDFGGKEYDCFIVEKFSGVLDGNGHTIFNFKITGTQNSDHAVIKNLGGLADTVVKDLTVGKADNLVQVLPNALAAGKSHGILCGAISNIADRTVTITDVTVYGELNFAFPNKGNAGGFVGYASPGQLLIEDCKFYGAIKYGDPTISSTEYMNAGGFIGVFKNSRNATLKNCENYADITVYPTIKEGRAAGIVGYTDGNIAFEDCKNYGNISAIDFDSKTLYMQSDSMCGGIIGTINKKTVSITNCVNYGTLLGTNRIGTMAAQISGEAAEAELVTIINCKNEGKVTADVAYFNGAYGQSGGTPKVEGYTNVNNETVEYTTLEHEVTTEYVEPDEPTTGATTTKEPDKTDAPTDDQTTTKAPDKTDDPAGTTAAPKDEKSCGGFAGAAAAIAVLVSVIGCAVIIKKN